MNKLKEADKENKITEHGSNKIKKQLEKRLAMTRNKKEIKEIQSLIDRL